MFLFIASVTPLCLPYGDYMQADAQQANQSGIIAGWGATTPGTKIWDNSFSKIYQIVTFRTK